MPVLQRHAGRYSYAAWSPDGKRLASMAELSGPRLFRLIALQEMATGEERDVQPALPNIGDITSDINWTSNGQSLLVGSISSDRRWGIFKVDPQTGEASTPLVTSERRLAFPQLSPDGGILYYVSEGKVLALDLLSGNKRVVLEPERGYYLHNWVALSPDGERVAVLVSNGPTNRVLAAPAKGGEARVLHEIKTSHLQNPLLQRWALTWSPDGRYVIFVQRPDEESAHELWRVPVAGGQPERLGLAVDRLVSPQVHPDGTRIAYITGGPFHDSTFEIWVLENFLPTMAAPKK
jgi:Tol biopolymer transport system component